MAGLSTQLPNASARIQPRPNEFSGQLVLRGVSLGRRVYNTHVPDGASAEAIIERAARDNGGFVLKVYYPQMNAWEIVAVKMGNELIVKGDLAKVLQSNLSDLNDCDRRAVLSAAKSSQGGLHIFLGADGIPISVGKDGGTVFPNGDELRLKGNGGIITVRPVSDNFDPGKLGDLESHYATRGGLQISNDAQATIDQLEKDEMSKSHGGVRSEKLMLDDNSVLILKMNSGELVTVSEHIKAEGFPALQLATPDYTCIGLSYPTDSGRLNVPMDGSRLLVPYLFVKVFDGKITDHISIKKPLPVLNEPVAKQEIIMPVQRQERMEARQELHFIFAPQVQKAHEHSPMPVMQDVRKEAVPELPAPPLLKAAPAGKEKFEKIVESWLRPRAFPIKAEVVLDKPRTFYHRPMPEPKLGPKALPVQPPREKKPENKEPAKLQKSKKPRKRNEVKLQPSKKSRPNLPLKKPEPQPKIQKRKTETPKPAARPQVKIQESKIPKRPTLPQARESKRPTARQQNMESKKKIPEPRRQKINRYFLAEMLGLTSRGRARAGNSGRRRTASRRSAR